MADAFPSAFTTCTEPELPAATTAVICVEETTVKDAAGVPPKVTAVVPVKLVPVMTTFIPVEAEVGEKPVTVGGRAKPVKNRAMQSKSKAVFRIRIGFSDSKLGGKRKKRKLISVKNFDKSGQAFCQSATCDKGFLSIEDEKLSHQLPLFNERETVISNILRSEEE